jgi:hypothetical protein
MAFIISRKPLAAAGFSVITMCILLDGDNNKKGEKSADTNLSALFVFFSVSGRVKSASILQKQAF